MVFLLKYIFFKLYEVWCKYDSICVMKCLNSSFWKIWIKVKNEDINVFIVLWLYFFL